MDKIIKGFVLANMAMAFVFSASSAFMFLETRELNFLAFMEEFMNNNKDIFNEVTLEGFVVGDPQTRSGKYNITKFNLSFWQKNGRGYVNVTSFDHIPIARGHKVKVLGRLAFDSWQGQDGAKRSQINIIANNVQILEEPKPFPNSTPSNYVNSQDRTSYKQPRQEQPPF